ncbi:MAG: hypothetical protein QXQ02_03260 [Halobacteria archaeon]
MTQEKGSKIDPVKLFKGVALAWMFGVGVGIGDLRSTHAHLLSRAADFWLGFQKKESGIEIRRGSPFEVASIYLEDCKQAGYNDPKDSIAGDDSHIIVEHYSCFYRGICLDMAKRDLPMTCPRIGLLANVIQRGSEKQYIYSVKVQPNFCRGILIPKLPPTALHDTEIEMLLKQLDKTNSETRKK